MAEADVSVAGAGVAGADVGVAGGEVGVAGAELSEDGYSGSAWLSIGEARFDVQVELRGHFQPIDGRYHWYGRLANNESLAELLAGAKASGVLETPHGTSPCEVSEPDTWQRYRLTGYSTPPFPLAAPDLS